MLFNTGTTSLITYTRDMAGDPSGAASPLFSDQRVKDAINDTYLEFRDAARQMGGGSGHKRSYADTVVDQVFYSLPTDFVRMVMVEIDGDGLDISSNSAASPGVLRSIGSDVGLELTESGDSSVSKYYFIHDQHFGISVPVSTAGTNAMRVTYEASTAELSAAGDEPDIPRPHHRLICYKAAVILRLTMDLPVNDLQALATQKEIRFIKAMQDQTLNPEGQFSVAGLGRDQSLTNFGRMNKI